MTGRRKQVFCPEAVDTSSSSDGPDLCRSSSVNEMDSCGNSVLCPSPGPRCRAMCPLWGGGCWTNCVPDVPQTTGWSSPERLGPSTQPAVSSTCLGLRHGIPQQNNHNKSGGFCQNINILLSHHVTGRAGSVLFFVWFDPPLCCLPLGRAVPANRIFYKNLMAMSLAMFNQELWIHREWLVHQRHQQTPEHR
ncbi:unnamed protein product [Pleuronectes platessa]|uniref:Uncharacterized protein n=1 Tax=Pleuronectes platessa TaxID=8262 RepID=A0A9N7UK44_PLEPL|nr:unnamed protein product [Pleuronectes platessa]